tara:strand:- start:2107 stop:2703 length:597 start_codon:yes stop_codon:yes gene_type:complete
MTKITYENGRLQDPKEDQLLMRVGKINFEPKEPEEEGENKALNELESQLRKHNLPEEERTDLRQQVQRLKYGQKLIVAQFTSTKTKTNGEQVTKNYYPIYAEVGVMFVPTDRETGKPIERAYDLQGNINIDGKDLNVYAYKGEDTEWSTGNMNLAFHTKNEMNGVPEERNTELPKKIEEFKEKVDKVLVNKTPEEIPF